MRSPALWGTRDRLDELFAGGRSVTGQTRSFVFRYRSPAHWLSVFRTWYGPVLKAFAGLAEPQQKALESDLLGLLDRFNTAVDGTIVVPSDYLEIVIVKA